MITDVLVTQFVMTISVSRFAIHISVHGTYFKTKEKTVFIYICVRVITYVRMYVMVKCVVLI